MNISRKAVLKITYQKGIFRLETVHHLHFVRITLWLCFGSRNGRFRDPSLLRQSTSDILFVYRYLEKFVCQHMI
jgi:hypothetical protein